MTLNAAASQAAKHTGQQLALDMSGDWKTSVLLELRGWLAIHRAKGHSTMTFEQFRHEAKSQPGSHKAWGSLPGIACRADLIAPLVHPDGSPVMRSAESVKTHGHHVRVWALVDPSFSFVASSAQKSPTPIERRGPQARHQPLDTDVVGSGLHTGSGSSLLQATADYHRQRDSMGRAGA